MPDPGRNQEPIARRKTNAPVRFGELKFRFSGKDGDPFVRWLVVPDARRRGLAFRYDSLDAGAAVGTAGAAGFTLQPGERFDNFAGGGVSLVPEKIPA